MGVKQTHYMAPLSLPISFPPEWRKVFQPQLCKRPGGRLDLCRLVRARQHLQVPVACMLQAGGKASLATAVLKTRINTKTHFVLSALFARPFDILWLQSVEPRRNA